MWLRLPLALSAVAAADAAIGNMTFFSIGDWGGHDDNAPTTASEVANGHGMQVAAEVLGRPGFVMLVGDNFYTHGIDGDVHSTRFQDTFENVFNGDALQCPFYAVAGNHDHFGNVTAQMAYSQISTRWRFPKLWYTFSETTQARDGATFTTQVVYIDTVVLAGLSYVAEDGRVVAGAPHPLHNARLRAEQLAWLEATLAASTADYLWVAGHYPVYSQCAPPRRTRARARPQRGLPGRPYPPLSV